MQLKREAYYDLQFNNMHLNLSNQEYFLKVLGRGFFPWQEMNQFEELLEHHPNHFDFLLSPENELLRANFQSSLKMYLKGKRAKLCPLSAAVNPFVAQKLHQDPVLFKDLDRKVFIWLLGKQEYRVAMSSKLAHLAHKGASEDGLYNWNIVPSQERKQEIEELYSYLVQEYGVDAIGTKEDCSMF